MNRPHLGLQSTRLSRTDRSSVRRKADRGRYDRETVNAILDEALVCHVALAVDGRPWVVPTTFVRVGDHLYLHGAAGNFALRCLASGGETCITVTLLDGLVLARSAFHHSMNYRSVMLFGSTQPVTSDEEKQAALLALVDHMVPGRSAATRRPTPEELRATRVLRFGIDEGSAKLRTGGPIEEPADLGLPHWGGVVPVTLVRGDPLPDLPATPAD